MEEDDSLIGKIIIILGTSSNARIQIFEHLWNLGARIIILNPKKNKLFSPFCSKWILMKTDNIDLMEKTIRESIGNPDGICTFDDYEVYHCAALCQRFEKRIIPFDLESIKNTCDKGLFRKWCIENEIPTPLVYEKDIVYPVVMKYTNGAGKLQTKMCLSEKEVQDHFLIMQEKNTSQILIEEYIPGNEVDIDCVFDNGELIFVSISDNFEPIPPFFAEVGGLSPSRLPEDIQIKFLDLLFLWIRKNNKITGVIHFEAKYDPKRQKCFIIEVNCRIGGAETLIMNKCSYGVHLGECAVRLACGLPAFRKDFFYNKYSLGNYSLPIPLNFCASINILPPEGGGYLVELILPGEENSCLVKTQAGMMEQTFHYYLGPPKEFGCVVWMVARGSSHDDAIKNIIELTKKTIIRFRQK
jgi:biotin carboxylase